MTDMKKLFDGMYKDHLLRIIEFKDEPWFIAKDVCNILGISNPSDALKRLDDNERSRFNLGRQGMTNMINEQGLYEMIFASRKAEAKAFKRWIKNDVLPSIRKHGMYATPAKVEEMINDPDTMIQVLQALKQERAEKEAAQRQIQEDRPKVVLAEALEISQDSVLIKELAALLRQKGYNTGQQRLFAWMRKEGYLCKKIGETYNLPTQRALDMGLFEVKVGAYHDSNGDIRRTRTTKVTGKGVTYFVNKLLGDTKAV